METTGQMYYGFGVLFLFLLISRIIDNPLYDLVWPANNFPTQNTTIFAWLNTNFAFYYNGPPFIVGSIIFQPWMIVNLIFLIGVAIAVFFMEKNFIPKAHHIFSIFTVFMSISSLVLALMQVNFDIFSTGAGYTWWEFLFGILTYFVFGIIPLIYWICAARSVGKSPS